jgi:hypothetical protein
VTSRRFRVRSVRVAASVPRNKLAVDQAKHTNPLHSLLYIMILFADATLGS